MNSDSNKNRLSPDLFSRIITIVGGYGSGKSEVAVNLAHYLAGHFSFPVSIADLDVVNPYFRSREAALRLSELGIRSIVPEGSQYYADLPIVLPSIKGALEKNDGILILDVGGDDVGARILGSLSDAFTSGGYDMLFVLNANRPFTSDVDGAVNIMREIEAASRLHFTGIISNTHMMDLTTVEIVADGLALAKKVCEEFKIPLLFLSAEETITKQLDLTTIDTAVLPLNRFLLKPWESSSNKG